MRLRELDADFIVEIPNGHRIVERIHLAQGVKFQCPKCAQGKERGSERVRRGNKTVTRHFVRGAHYVICWFRNPRRKNPVSADAPPGPGRWWIEGTSLDDLTFTHGEPPLPKSVQLSGPGCGWHGFVTNGEATLQ